MFSARENYHVMRRMMRKMRMTATTKMMRLGRS
jgi:hypothetical protein